MMGDQMVKYEADLCALMHPQEVKMITRNWGLDQRQKRRESKDAFNQTKGLFPVIKEDTVGFFRAISEVSSVRLLPGCNFLQWRLAKVNSNQSETDCVWKRRRMPFASGQDARPWGSWGGRL